MSEHDTKLFAGQHQCSQITAKEKAFERWWKAPACSEMENATSKKDVAYLTFEAGWNACAGQSKSTES